MKISVRQYAQSLYESVQGREKSELKSVIENFVCLLAKRRELGRAEAIVTAFSEIWDKEEGRLQADISTARTIDQEAKKSVSAYLQKRSGAKTIELKERTDAGMLGGFILRYRDKVVDASLKSSLKSLRSKMAA